MTAVSIDKPAMLEIYSRYLEVVDSVRSIIQESVWSHRALAHWRYDKLEIVVPERTIGLIYSFWWSAGVLIWTDETLLRSGDDACSKSFFLNSDAFDAEITVSDIINTIEPQFEEAVKRAKREWDVKNLEWSANDHELPADDND
ncbi:hypothetical protein [Roseibium litorale]|uniref:Uncharacterized protein n=1 Tax=Roseibium litorale TaxID=2803841 RepID=A0ABR9CV06_9HYPH|nr:hypothetical protein [Roseibium litorale]MBD8894160.1 hypothetical protein [Roseibium litorale]